MSTNEIHNTFSAKQTRDLGEKIAMEVLKKKQSAAFVLALKGDLGGGKTTFLQGFARGLGIKEKILSPTFVIMKNYKLSTTNYKLFYHVDCYRIKSPKDISELGLKEIFSNPKNIVAIEWAEKIKAILPKNAFWLKFEFVNKNKRNIMFFI